MSVLVRGMKMPDCCANCPFQILEREKYISFQYVIDASECERCDGFMTEHESYSKMLPKCPLVDVPTPHRRLIEEPELFYYGGLVKISPLDFIGTAKYFSDQVKAMPTIIEAEEV